MATDYAKKTNAELVEILKSRDLPHTGKKAEMVARLQENDSAGTAAPAQNENAEDVIDWEDDEVSAPKPAETAAPAEAPAATENNTAAPPKAEETKTEEASQGAEASQENPQATIGAGEESQQAEEKPAPNFAIGLSVTDLEEELKKRKARAEKFGITEDSQAAIDATEKKLERAKRFGTGNEQAPATDSVSRLDQALPEKSRKRGRGDNDQGGRGGKRRTNQRQRGRGNRGQGQNRRQNQVEGQAQSQKTNNASNGWNEKDKEAMEARKKRFGA